MDDNRPLWNPYMLSWRTNDEILVCLKYCLIGAVISGDPAQKVTLSMDIREHSGEFSGRRHDETLFGIRPPDEMLYVVVLEHAAN